MAPVDAPQFDLRSAEVRPWRRGKEGFGCRVPSSPPIRLNWIIVGPVWDKTRYEDQLTGASNGVAADDWRQGNRTMKIRTGHSFSIKEEKCLQSDGNEVSLLVTKQL